MAFTSPIEKLKTSALVKNGLKKLGLKTLADILFYFPFRYEEFLNVAKIKDLKLYKTFSVQGEIVEIANFKTPKKRIILTQALLRDETGSVKIIWFNQPYLLKTLNKGEKISIAGPLTLDEKGVYFLNPAFEKIKDNQEPIHTKGLVPVYQETRGLSSKTIRRIVKNLLDQFKEKIPETFPLEILQKYQLPSLKDALKEIHFPASLAKAELAKKRFQFENIFLLQLFLLRERLKLNQEKAAPIPINLELLKRFKESLPFELTNAQKKASWQILKDLEKTKPMNRLLEGDVGSGKTVVATLAALSVIKAGFQVALMAPTEVLAKQHFQEISKLLEDFNINIGLLTGKQDKFISKKLKSQAIEISREKLLKKTLAGEIDFLIGTHALIQDQVKFNKLALVILDEQHRFGIEQRAKLLKQTGEKTGERLLPHLLSMSATPIPRTLALALYGDLDLSIIDELPKGRKKIKTQLINPEEREKAYELIRKEIKKGRQVFIICPRIEENKNSRLEMKAVKKEFEILSKKVFPDLKILMLHGKMKTTEKEKIMEDFKNHKADILVTTSVIEVGIDVPNASVIAIEGAERFGLAQLHQLRGRVGRSQHQSFCLLFAEKQSQKTKSRLRALLESENGFELAEKDLKLRGPGDFIGNRQWGLPDIAMAGLENQKLVIEAKNLAKEILAKDPNLKKYPRLEIRLKKFQKMIHLE
jgi:ATP-dependent DNA helicase RecG